MLIFMRMLFVVLVVVLSGCVSAGEKFVIEQDIYQLQQRVLNLESSLKKKSDTVEELEGTSRKSLASNTVRLDQVEENVQRILGELEGIKIGVNQGEMPGAPEDQESIKRTVAGLKAILEGMQETLAEANTPKASGSQKLSTLTEIKKAFSDKRFRHVVDSADNIKKDVKSNSDKQDLAFMYAESLYKLGDLKSAALRFNDFLDLKPKGERLRLAKLRMGDCFRHLGDKKTARAFYEDLIQSAPKSDDAASAKKRLESL